MPSPSPSSDHPLVRWFSQIAATDGPIVGGKAASLGEMYQTLGGRGVLIPNGFATTAEAYATFMASEVAPDSWAGVTPHESLGRASLDALRADSLSEALEILLRDVDFEDALVDLKSLDEGQANVVDLRFFGGLKMEEIAHVLGVSMTTVEGDWRHAKAWLRDQLKS